ncbi:polysaccharide deacetylase family protein [Spiroplasma endosymbiont of Atherix ibis]|uniref:polysaccharide deacetylase family protein n=1 Tax=Spiroplasma endosymbiont of Atherix ibis TaxID=3066291 RepID=UPI0030D403CB
MKKKVNLINISIVFIVVFCIIFNFATPKHNYEVNRINTNQKVVMLTFDDGPSTSADVQIMNILDKYDAKATFFGTGINYQKYFTDQGKTKAVIDRMIKDDHTLGNHSYNHNNYHFKTKEAYEKEFYKTSELLVKIYAENGIKKNISDIPVRMPYLQYYRGMGYLQEKLEIKYFVRGYLGCDYNEKICGKEKILKQYKSHLSKGQIFVCHTRDYATQWLPNLLEFLKENNYTTTNFNNEQNWGYKKYGGLIF